MQKEKREKMKKKRKVREKAKHEKGIKIGWRRQWIRGRDG